MGFSHVICTNICIWLRALVNEIYEAFQHENEKMNHSIKGNASTDCESSEWTDYYVNKIIPFLFPFVLEYSLIAMAIFICMYLRLLETSLVKNRLGTGCKNQSNPQEQNNERNIERRKESLLEKSHTGLFLGVLHVAGAIVSIVIFHHYLLRDKDRSAMKVFYFSDIISHCVLLFGCCLVMYHLWGLEHKFSAPTVDDVLLLIGLAGNFILEFVIAGSNSIYIRDHGMSLLPVLGIVSSLLSISQSIFQSLIIPIGLRVCCKNSQERQIKPGRQAITFVLLGNVALWASRSFEAKELQMQTVSEVIGRTMWLIVMNVSSPLLLFFRFHSSVCFAHVWKQVYEEPRGEK